MKNIREYLGQLGKELQRSDDFDVEARQILSDLHKDVDKIEESGKEHVDVAVSRIQELEAKFATKHPAMEQMARELTDALAKMGI